MSGNWLQGSCRSLHPLLMWPNPKVFTSYSFCRNHENPFFLNISSFSYKLFVLKHNRLFNLFVVAKITYSILDLSHTKVVQKMLWSKQLCSLSWKRELRNSASYLGIPISIRCGVPFSLSLIQLYWHKNLSFLLNVFSLQYSAKK